MRFVRCYRYEYLSAALGESIKGSKDYCIISLTQTVYKNGAIIVGDYIDNGIVENVRRIFVRAL